MEFYDRADSQYLNLIKHSMFLWRVKLELLDHYENTVACIEQDIDYGNAGSITCNNSQGTRKSCSITLINVDLKYIPTEDSPFWFNRKFRLYIGLVDNRHYKQNDANVHWTNETDTYWFSKGVYITQDIHVDSTAHTVSISGIDKYAQLDGTLNVLQADEMNTVFEYGAKIKDVIRDILTLDMGNGMVLDPIDPMIDDDSLNSIYLYKEFTLSAGQYYGDFLNELATSYGAEVFYDNIGRLVFRRSFSDDFPYWIGFRAPVIEVKYHLPGYQNPQESMKLTGVNKIIVATDNVETPNGSYTAINKNPRSPLCYNKIGARTLPENGGVVIINAGNIVTNEEIEQDPSLQGEAEELVVKRCRDYAEYRLMQETCLATSISFSCSPYLHLNEGDVIAITDPDFALDCDLYIINSITFPLGADSIQLEVSNLGFLNNDISSQTQYSALPNSPIKFGIHYIVGDVTGTAPANQLIGGGEDFITPNDYNEDTHIVSFAKENHELLNWTDNINGTSYDLGVEYHMPNQSFTMMANYISYKDYVLELRMNEVGGAGTPYTFNPITDQDDDIFSTMFLTINNRKYYFWGRDFEKVSTISAEIETTQTIKYGCVPIVNNTVMIFNNTLASLLSNGINNGKVVYLKYPNAVENLALDISDALYLQTLILPENVTNITVPSPTPESLKTIEFNNKNDLSVDIGGGNNFLVGNNFESVTAINHVSITTGIDDSYILYYNGDSSSSIRFPDITFAKGIKVDNSNSQGNCYFLCCITRPTLFPNTEIIIGNSESLNRYKGGLELINVTSAIESLYFWGSYVLLTLGNVYIEHSNVAIQYVRRLTITGNVNVCDDSVFLSGTQILFSDAMNFTFEGDYININNSIVMNNTSLKQIDVTSEITFENGGKFITNNPNLTTVYFRDGVDIDGNNVANSMYFVTGNNYCTTIHFYGSVNIECGTTQDALLFICNNNRLADVYFHDDNFVVSNSSYGKLFDSNNANFKLHGIDNGNVQAFAVANNIPFEVIPSE